MGFGVICVVCCPACIMDFKILTIPPGQICEDFWGAKVQNSPHSQAVLYSEDRCTQIILMEGYKAKQEKFCLVQTALGQHVRARGFSQCHWEDCGGGGC